ncbi:hypothetical protein ACI4BE_30280, partial [Klebsiella pneumoniae]|uniref:hypothetical protein n=1 Tax=Klebsiella pneumoniae TaxID=573 RepID=UPI003853B3B8
PELLRQIRGPLTAAERATARDMRAAGATNAQIAARLNRRLKGFHLLLRALDRPETVDAPATPMAPAEPAPSKLAAA